MALERPEIDFPEGTPPQYLDITDITVGDGPEATKGSTVSVHYVGVSFSTGEEFDASWNRGQAFEFPLGGASWSSRRTWPTATAARARPSSPARR
jgi:peptidylprolyl isomerase